MSPLALTGGVWVRDVVPAPMAGGGDLRVPSGHWGQVAQPGFVIWEQARAIALLPPTTTAPEPQTQRAGAPKGLKGGSCLKEAPGDLLISAA